MCSPMVEGAGFGRNPARGDRLWNHSMVAIGTVRSGAAAAARRTVSARTVSSRTGAAPAAGRTGTGGRANRLAGGVADDGARDPERDAELRAAAFGWEVTAWAFRRWGSMALRSGT